MNTKTITVTSVEWPQAGKKMGAVIDNEGQRWGVWPDKLSGYQQFRTYEVVYKTRDYQGRTYHTIETARPVGNGITDTGLIRPQKTGYNPATPVTFPPRHDESFDDKRRMDIFVCGAFNNIMSNPNMSPTKLTNENMVSLVNGLKQVWKLTLGPQAQAVQPRGASDDEMNDSIPFE